MNCRSLAARVLLRVWKDESFAAAVLSAELDRSGLEPRDRGLCTELTYGVLRTERYLKRRLSSFGKLKESDVELMAHLLVAAYQLDFLDRVPARAAIYEAVELVTALRGRSVGGFANALLRRLSESPAEGLVEATVASAPSWIRKRLLRDVGSDEMKALLAPQHAPRPYLRMVGSGPIPPWVEEECTSCSGVPSAYLFVSGGDPRKRAGYAEGAFVVQELGAQLVAHALGAQTGERVLDVCAGRGQKSTLLKEQVGAEGLVCALDLHDHKLRALSDEARRLNLEIPTQSADLCLPLPFDLHSRFDRVLVDAPCSGVGTLRRRPEIARRLAPEDPARLGQLQLQIAKNAALALRPGGVLLFATCSVFSEEGEEVVAQLCDEGGLKPTDLSTVVELFARTGLAPDQARSTSVRLLPGLHGTDGYFLARLRRV